MHQGLLHGNISQNQKSHCGSYYCICFEIILGFAMHIVQKYSWDMLLWILYLVYVHILSFHVLFKNKCVECV